MDVKIWGFYLAGTDEANNSTIPIEEALKDETRIMFHYNHLKFVHKAIQYVSCTRTRTFTASTSFDFNTPNSFWVHAGRA